MFDPGDAYGGENRQNSESLVFRVTVFKVILGHKVMKTYFRLVLLSL